MKSDLAVHLDTKPEYKRDRMLYIIQAAVEYFITIIVGTTYLAKVALSIGMTDTDAAMLSSVLEFAYAFQLLSILFNRGEHPKRWIAPMLVVIEICFTLVYVVPIAPIPSGIKPVILVASVLIGNVCFGISSSTKATWMIGFVADDNRGKFTAWKEIVSLISGMIYSYIMGSVIDSYEARGDLNGAFTVCAITVAGLSIVHVVLLLCTREVDDGSFVSVSLGDQLKSIFTDKSFLKILPISIIWGAANMVATPFYNTYELKELGFEMAFIAITAAVASIARALFSVPFGNFADHHGFAKLLTICYSIVGVGFLINVFAVPENGRVLFTIYKVLNAIAWAGIGSANSNLIFEYVSPQNRAGALAIRGTAYGLVGFLSTLAVTPLVNYIQANGNQFLGMHLYAQQVVSIIAVIMIVFLIIYLNTVVKKVKTLRDIK